MGSARDKDSLARQGKEAKRIVSGHSVRVTAKYDKLYCKARTMGVKRAFAWNTAFLLCSLTTTIVVGVFLPLADISPDRFISETVLIIVFFGCYTVLLTHYWYWNTDQPDQAEDVP